MKGKLYISIFLSLIFTSCLQDLPLKISDDFQPKSLNDGWVTSTPETENINVEELSKAFTLVMSEDEDFRTAKSMLVIRNGVVVAEWYSNNENINELGNVMSVAKSITSLLIGIAIENDFISNDLSLPFLTYFPELINKYPDKANITIRDLLQMTSGIDYEEYWSSRELLTNQNILKSTEYILGLPQKYPAGDKFEYKSGDTWLLGALLQRQTDMNVEEFAEEYLFKPLEIEDVEWTAHQDGLNNAAFNLIMKPRDLAKIGQLVLDSGNWEGKQIIPIEWVETSTNEQINSSSGPYGFCWWILPYFKGFTANGHGGQYCTIIPEKDLVIILTAEPYIMKYDFGITQKKYDRLLYHIINASL